MARKFKEDKMHSQTIKYLLIIIPLFILLSTNKGYSFIPTPYPTNEIFPPLPQIEKEPTEVQKGRFDSFNGKYKNLHFINWSKRTGNPSAIFKTQLTESKYCTDYQIVST